ncbi:hypothetical protein CALVIDRAFT_599150 [Calocera viscosa TUFC12733]|uniref:Kinetochore protein Sos7 coiled-coil domain-containing protein n=1 Tax=Calocera viscosa (strain TUFC12733) TaxID=1330018 RepID=A0A167L5M9_CALVF|nr:hypothetical protein CALVIDRAFT_599150 [Calocera viscosa TUFC12733]
MSTTSELDLDAVRKLAQSYTAHPLHLTALHASYLDRASSDLPTLSDSLISLQPLNPALIDRDVADHKDYFTKVKFKYLEQESKERFLRYILREDPPSLRAAHNMQLEQTNTALKTSLKTSKLALDTSITQLRALAPAIEASHSQTSSDAASAAQLVKSIRDMELELARLRAQHPPETRMTISRATQILDEQVETLQELTGELHGRTQALGMLKGRLQGKAKELEKVELERIAAEGRLMQAKRASEGRDGSVEKLVSWYTTAIAGYKDLMGIVSLSAHTENELRVVYTTPVGERTLCLVFEPGTGRLGDARVLEEKLDLSEAVDLAVAGNDVPGLEQDVAVALLQTRGCEITVVYDAKVYDSVYSIPFQ